LMFSEGANNENLEYALSGFAFFLSEDVDNESTKKAVHAYGKALEQVNYDEAKAFLIENLRIIGLDDAVPYLATYLANERLASPAARALASIGTSDAEEALLAAMQNEKAEALLLPLIQALGDIESQKAATAIEPYVLAGNEEIKKVAIYSLARIGSPSSAKVLASTASAADYRYENTHASSEYLNYIKNVAANGETKRAIKLAKKLHKSASKEGQFHSKAGALNLLASLDGTKSVKLLQKAAVSPEAAYRNTALALARKDMGSHLETWAKIL